VGATTNEAGRAAFSTFLGSALADPAFLPAHPLAKYMAIRGWKMPGVEEAPASNGLPDPYNVAAPALRLAHPARWIWERWNDHGAGRRLPARARRRDAPDQRRSRQAMSGGGADRDGDGRRRG
jgi:hypothetical protein